MKKHPFIFTLIIFLIISLSEFYFTKISILDSLSIGTISAFVFGFYLIYAGILIFQKVFKSWEEKSPWGSKLFLAFLILILFSILFTIVLSLAKQGTCIFCENYSGKTQSLTSFIKYGLGKTSNYSIFTIPFIIIPVTLYSLYLAIKSFRLVKQKKNNNTFGITIIAWNVIVLIISYYFYIIIRSLW